MSFQLDDRLARDTFVIGDLPLCRVLLMNDARWPWLILVPRREGMVELIDLELADQTQLMDEAGRASRFLKSHLRPDKINVGALGNIVRQLHLHIVARVVGDPAWPGPVWGHSTAMPYDDGAERALIAAGREGLPIQLSRQARLHSSSKTRMHVYKYDDSEMAPQPIGIAQNGLKNGAHPLRPYRVNPRIAPRSGNRHKVRHPWSAEARDRGVAGEVVRENFASDGGDHVRRIPGPREYVREAVRPRRGPALQGRRAPQQGGGALGRRDEGAVWG